MKGFVYETIARFSDTDLYEVVHHSNYFRWIEEARMQMLEDVLGLSLMALKERNINIPVIHIDGKFIRPVLARQKVMVTMVFRYTGTAKLGFDYEIKNEKGEVAFRGTSDHVLVQDGKMLFGIPEDLDRLLQNKMIYNKDFFVIN